MEALECQYSIKADFEQQLEEFVENLPSQSQQSEQQLQSSCQLMQHSAQHHQEQMRDDVANERQSSKILSPNKIGHEFVKQYYRILYKAPEILHRFYTNDSTCTRHDFNMVIGKREIQQFFQRENYRKCRTNIFNTDIHGTIANGVIVLVTGEQGNFGSPMRSFVQTFVLAAEGPRKYYVCNDIFRYADIFTNSSSMATSTTKSSLASAMTLLVDVECQTSSLHIGDGDRESLESSVEHSEIGVGAQQLSQEQQQQQQQLHQQLSSKAPIYDFCKSTVSGVCGGIGGGVAACAIPMPRWASARPSRDSSASSNYTHTFSQQETFTIHATDGDSNLSENLPLSDFNTSQHDHHHQIPLDDPDQPEMNEYTYYRSLIAQALSPRMEFEEVPPLSNQYLNALYYSEDVTRTSVGVSSLVRTSKRRGADSQHQQQQHQHHQQHQQQLYAMQSNEDEMNATSSNDIQENQPPTYAKLFMNALTRAGMKSNNNPMVNNTNGPIKGTNVPNLYNAPRSQNSETTSSPTVATAKTSAASNNHQLTGTLHGIHQQHHPHSNRQPQNQNHQQQQQQHQQRNLDGGISSYAPVAGSAASIAAAIHTQDYSPVQRNNYSNSSGMRRNDRRRSSSAQKYNDNQQLFLGQIPHNATEDELVRIFSCFGNVLELRILPNLNGKIQPGAKHPLKYGFLTFEHVESVKVCLESRPVYFPNNSPDGQKLNVRAKKPAVSRDEQTPLNCQSLDSQSLTSEWPQARRNNSISSASTIGSSAAAGACGSGSGIGVGNPNNVYNRKDNRNVRATSLDSSITKTTATTPPAIVGGGSGGGGVNAGGNRKYAQVANGMVNGCGGRR